MKYFRHGGASRQGAEAVLKLGRTPTRGPRGSSEGNGASGWIPEILQNYERMRIRLWLC